MALASQRAMYEILTQYLEFTMVSSELQFPPDFLDGSSDETLGEPLLRYITEHGWPFPQQLPH
jgi:hypothetical protein